ncbi:MAG: hypothetical protein LBM77_09775 [Spirochaetaceae bacterium]|jgi:protein AbiQ|nr:hypothetical protein [Spirochaetaceae bacterium]
MHFSRLSHTFYEDYTNCREILTKEERPYYVLLVEVQSLTFAIPLRSHIHHPYCFLAASSDVDNSGLDFSKAVVITDIPLYVDPAPVTIRQDEFDIFKTHEFQIKQKFERYVKEYKKKVERRSKNPALPEDSLCRYSALQYFHKELGLT